jgi:hemerythrin-like metal-binding protein
MIIAWNEAFDVGIPEIDSQHRDLIETFNRLVDSLHSDDGQVQPLMIINELTGKAKIHADYEEDLMRTTGYPGTDAHAEEHRSFARDIEDLSQRMLTTGKPRLQLGSLKILGQRLIDHTCAGTDSDLVAHLKANR